MVPSSWVHLWPGVPSSHTSLSSGPLCHHRAHSFLKDSSSCAPGTRKQSSFHIAPPILPHRTIWCRNHILPFKAGELRLKKNEEMFSRAHIQVYIELWFTHSSKLECFSSCLCHTLNEFPVFQSTCWERGLLFCLNRYDSVRNPCLLLQTYTTQVSAFFGEPHVLNSLFTRL